MDDPEVRRSKQVRRLASRIIHDQEGVRWEVHEIAEDTYDRRDARSLVFACDETMRRVRSFPSNWLELSDAELYALSMGR